MSQAFSCNFVTFTLVDKEHFPVLRRTSFRSDGLNKKLKKPVIYSRNQEIWNWK